MIHDHEMLISDMKTLGENNWELKVLRLPNGSSRCQITPSIMELE